MPKRKQKSTDEFASWRSYWDFRREVAREWRYTWSDSARAFLTTVVRESHSRVAKVSKGAHFYRAQVAHHDVYDPNVDDAFPGPALPERMRPLAGRASEGRANPKGIPCLYMAVDRHTALAECRPWIGSLVSIGAFKINRDLKVVDCTIGTDRHLLFLDGEPTAKKKSESVWADIGRAFRAPVMRDDNTADYAPTQVIAEAFHREGFDGVAYRSSFGTDRFNLAIFDLDAASIVMNELHEIKDVEFKFDQTANPYYVQAGDDGKNTLVQNVITSISPVEPSSN
ncbi:MAG: RES domain-containing protein [Mesorhizobium sp.]|nr:MAG: RES domain-containing protein [Mesorhizobium sp.]